MASYKPTTPFNAALMLLIPTSEIKTGVRVKTFPSLSDGERINASFKTFGGTETTENGVYSVVDTAVVETWYRPDIKADCRIGDPETGTVYEILGTPEDIQKRHQFLKFKIRAVKGGA